MSESSLAERLGSRLVCRLAWWCVTGEGASVYTCQSECALLYDVVV